MVDVTITVYFRVQKIILSSKNQINDICEIY
jgi:hypothetical protein